MYVSGLDGFIWLLLNTNWKLHNGIAKVSLVHQMLMPTNTKWKFYLKSTNRNTLNGGTIDIYVEVWIHERALLLQEHWCHKLLNSSWHCVSYANVSGKGSLILPLGRILIICLFSCLKVPVWQCEREKDWSLNFLGWKRCQPMSKDDLDNAAGDDVNILNKN